MKRRVLTSSLVIGLVFLAGTISAPAQSIAPDYDYEDYDRAQIDRYLDIEVWTDHSDGEYYEGDDIVIHFRVNRDAFVALYSIDTRGRVNLLFPTYHGEENYVQGGVTYSLPGGDDDFDLEVSGPEGFENIQIIASREEFPIPDWYQGPELVAYEEDRDGYMDWINSNHFSRYSGQRFAYDRAVIYVSEWEQEYFRPIYRPYYPSWTVYGNCYIDYPWGGSVYVNGVYWGCAPLYVPRIAVGWHTVTIYDHYGHCWENDFHVSRYNTVVFNKTIIRTSPSVRSKYKEVRAVGYRNPASHGYPDYEARKKSMATVYNAGGTANKSTRSKTGGASVTTVEGPSKKYVRGSTKLVKTNRGYEADASSAVFPGRVSTSKRGSTSRDANTGEYRTSTQKRQSESGKYDRAKSTAGSSGSSYKRSGSSDSRRESSKSGSSSRLKSSSDSKSGSSSLRRRTTGQARPKAKSSSGSVTKREKSSSKSSDAKQQKSSNKNAKQSTPKSSKSSSTKSSSKSSTKSSSSKSKSGGKKK